MIDIGFAGALIGGLLSLLSPCSVMLLPAFFAYAFGSPRQLLARTGLFYLGLVASLVPLGIFASTLGSALLVNRSTLITVVGALVIVAGVLLLVGVRVPLPSFGRAAAAGEATSALSTFLLGTVYAVAGVCAGPILGSVLLVASLGSPVYGAALMALYGLGMSLPLLVLALIWGRVGAKGMAWLKPRQLEIPVGRFTWRNSWIMIISGLLTIGVGVLLVATDGTAGLSGWLDVASQARLEQGALGLLAGVPDLVFVVAAIIVIGIIALLANRDPAPAAAPEEPSP